jgi:hypothetical protein
MLGLPVLLMLSAAPSLAQPPFNTANVPADVAGFCAEHLAVELSSRGVRVITPREIAAMLGVERQRELLGCNDANASSCIAELGNALGADGLLLGDLGRIGKRYQLNIRIVRGGTGELALTWSGNVDSESDLLPLITKAADTLAPQIAERLHAASTAGGEIAAQSGGARRWPLWPTLLAGGFVVVGAVLDGLAGFSYGRLTTPSMMPFTTFGDASAVATQGKAFMYAAPVAYGLAAASLVLALVLFLRGGPG